MAIVRTAEWKLVCSASEAEARIRTAMTELSFEPDGSAGVIRGKSKGSVFKNRWAANMEATISSDEAGSVVVWRIDMAGTRHYALLEEITANVGDHLFDDRGLSSTAERLGKVSRIFGRREIRHLRNLLYASEQVVELGQGVYDGKQGLVVLTSERLFFLEKSLGSETMEQFALSSIHSLSVSKKMTGEKLVVHTSGNQSEVKQMMHGQADALVRAFRNLKHAESAANDSSGSQRQVPQTDVLGQIEKLAELHSKGVISDSEFADKKAELMDRL